MYMPTASEIRGQAAEWVVRLDRDCTAAERQQFQSWLDADPRHRAAYDAAYQLWCELDEVAAVLPEAAQLPRPAPRTTAPVIAIKSTAPRAHSRWPAWTALAATLVLAVGLFAAPELEVRLRADLRADVGQSLTRVLEDGSTVQLNTDTAIAVRYTEGRRDIELLRGEAAFEVAHDAARPFVVHARRSSVTALGTVFQVRAGEDLQVTVTEGRVRVRSADAYTDLGAGHRLSVSASGEIGPPGEADIYAAEAWRRGYVSFVERPLSEVVQELNRYVRGRIVLTDARLESLPVSGTFPTNRPDAAIGALQQSLGLRVTRFSDYLILLN